MSVILVAIVALILSSCFCETVQLESDPNQQQQQPNVVHYCNIYNEHHHPFYMYATSRFFSVSAVSRSVYLWSQFLKNGNITLFGSNGDDQSIWRLEPVANRTACYRIRNVLYDELLYRSTFLSGLAVPARNYVYTWSEWVLGGRATVVSQDDEAFMWTFKDAFEPAKKITPPGEQDQDSSRMGKQQAVRVFLSRVRKATIWNVKFNEPLYVPLFGGNGILGSRVYTWSGYPDSKLFNWILTCTDDGQ